MELGPEAVSLLERCPHFRGWYVQASMELGPKQGCKKVLLDRGLTLWWPNLHAPTQARGVWGHAPPGHCWYCML